MEGLVGRSLGGPWFGLEVERAGWKGGTSEDISGGEGEGAVSDGPVGLVASVQMCWAIATNYAGVNVNNNH